MANIYDLIEGEFYRNRRDLSLADHLNTLTRDEFLTLISDAIFDLMNPPEGDGVHTMLGMSSPLNPSGGKDDY
jgi:hypothetical protein